ncbi:MAG: response regulator transcription factor [Propionibacteriaceae bacterium]|nr:response regulator transcription factor [Propionibacteriaceae bacterium]
MLCPEIGAGVRVFVAEDQFLLRQGLENLLVSNGLEVAGVAGSGTGLVEAVIASAADVALLDIRMPPTNTDEGIRAALELRRRLPGYPVVLLSQYVEQLYLNELLADGGVGVGYLLKDRVFDDVSFVAALRSVASGGTMVDPAVVTAMMQRRTTRQRLEQLTPREQEVLALMAEGHANAAIAGRLFVTDKAVQKHINSIFMKLELDTSGTTARRVQAVLTHLRG